MVTQIIFYLIVSVSMVIIFYQWGVIVDKISLLFDKIVSYEQAQATATKGIVPALVMLIFKHKTKKQ